MGKGQKHQVRSADGIRPTASRSAVTGTALALSRQPLCVTDLEAMDRDGLLRLWRDCCGVPAPKGMSLTFLRRFLAFDLQARSHGGLPAPLLAKLGRIEAGQDRTASPVLKSGGRLLREWNGITHVIDATPEGYLWQGQHHRSLSAIARAITGAQWSGPRFFGLKAAETAAARKGHAAASTATAAAAARRRAGSR